jgi:tetratricopeptide (TPR) repeat protein
MVLNNYAKSLRELGRLKEARDYADRAYAKAQKVGHQLVINQSLIERARIYRALHEESRAAAMLAEVEPRLRKDLPPGHYAFAVLASEQAMNAVESGDTANALKLGNEAISIEEAAIKSGGEGLYYLPSLLLCRSTIELKAGLASRAAADATRAVNLIQPGLKPGTSSSVLGHAYLALGRAEQDAGNIEQSRAAFRSAAPHLLNTVGPDHADTRLAQQLSAVNNSHS